MQTTSTSIFFLLRQANQKITYSWNPEKNQKNRGKTCQKKCINSLKFVINIIQGEKAKPSKCKRGFKFCKNDICKKQLPIHTSICPDCKHDQKMQKSKKIQNESKEIIQKLKKKKTLISKNLQQAFSIKKRITFLVIFCFFILLSIKRMNSIFLQNKIPLILP